MSYVVKPQTPLMLGENGLYPMTTSDQVVVGIGTENERRLEVGGKIVADEATHAEDSNKLGGKDASAYTLNQEIVFHPLSLTNGATVGEPHNSYYAVVGKLCIVNMAGITAPNNGDIVTGLPKAAKRSNVIMNIGGNSYPIFYIDQNATNLRIAGTCSTVYTQLIYVIADE